jgi:hypothetical protein
MQAKIRAIFLGIRQRSISVLEELIDLMLLDSIGDYMKSEDGKHKAEDRQILRWGLPLLLLYLHNGLCHNILIVDVEEETGNQGHQEPQKETEPLFLQ